MKNEYYYLGHITKPFGIKGQLCCYFDTDEPEKYANLDAVFIDLDDEKLPYLIEDIQYRGANTFVIKFADVDEEVAKGVVKAELYLPLSELPPLTGNKFYFHEVKGFRVVDSEYGDIGVLQQVVEYPAQPLFQIDKNGTEVLVPVIDEVIDKVDRELKTLFITAPKGLIELYLGDINK